jgi:PAS domain S-box-containing protein
MKKNYKKIEEKLTSEGAELRQPVAELEAPATERKQTEHALRIVEREKTAILDSMSELVVYQDTEHRIIWTNKAAAESAGMTHEQLVGRHCYEIWPRRDTPCVGCPVAKARQTGKPQEAEIATPDGRTWSIRGYPIRDVNDCVVGAVEMTLDITERKKAEQALADEATRRRILTDQSLDGIVVLDEDAKVYEANQRFAEMLGYTLEEVRELHTWDWDTQWSREELLEMVRSVGEAGDHFETRHRRKDGTTIDVAISTNGAIFAGQKLVFCVCRDVTKKKQMEHQLQENNEQLDAQNEELRSINEELQATEEELQDSRERLERMFESVTDGIIVAALDGTILKVNQRAVQMHGSASDDELLGKNADDLVAPGDRERIRNEMLKVQEKGAIRYQECNLVKADGSEFPAELSTSALRDASGKVIGRITIARDITERKQAEEREDQLQQELNLAGRLASIGQLAAGVAHEINNPLTGVIGFSHLMLNRDIPDDMKQDLQVIHSEAQRVSRIVENLLVFAHQRKTGREYIAINDIITRVLELRAYEMKVNNIEVENQLDPELPLTLADAGQLQQVFLNIVLNAEYFITKAHNKGKLLVKTEKIDGNIRASFTDDGTGISAENLDKIFNPFFTTKEVGKGTGLGLSICHGIITHHQGRIYAQSQPGKGATFVVELPIVADPSQPGRAEVNKKEPGKPRGAKILVVDDEAAILTFLNRLLTECGHSVETINNADTALKRLRTERYSLVLLDIKLPGMSGIELYHHIEEIAPALARRVIFITGDVMESSTRSFLEKTGVPYITKPLDIEVLKKTINRALNRTRVTARTSG